MPVTKVMLPVLLVASLQGQAPFGSAQEPVTDLSFQPSTAGCAMVHCDSRMSDNVRLSPPLGPTVVVVSHDPEPTGAGNPAISPVAQNQGNGCAGNGTIAVCAYNNTFGNNVVAYAADGSRLWTSGSLLNSSAFASVPMVAADGGAIAADNRTVVRFAPGGDVVWSTPTPGGTPVSPVVTAAGAIVLATRAGPISAFDGLDGHLIGSLDVRQEPGAKASFDTMNTPCVLGNRVYVSMGLRDDPAKTAWLVAVDVDATDPIEPLRIAWHFTFGAPSGASPLCIGDTIYFDGGRLQPGDADSPQMFAVRDTGTAGALTWARPAPRAVPSSFAQDPRGGFWVIFFRYPLLQRRSRQTGALLEAIDIRSVVGGTSLPHSVLTISHTPSSPIITLGTLDSPGTSAYVVAIDLASGIAKWQVNIMPSFGVDNVTGQFPIVVDTAGKAVVVFSGRTSGAYFVTEP